MVLEELKEASKLTSNISALLIPVSLGLTAIIFSNLNYNFQIWVKVVVFTSVVLQSLLYIFSLITGISLIKEKEELNTKFKYSFYSLIGAISLTALTYCILLASFLFK